MLVSIITCVLLFPWSLLIAFVFAAWRVSHRKQPMAAPTFKRASPPEPGWQRFRGYGPAPEPLRDPALNAAKWIRDLRRLRYSAVERAPFPAARPQR